MGGSGGGGIGEEGGGAAQKRRPRRDVRSALEVIIDGKQLDLLTLPRVRDLLLKKWTAFAERQLKRNMSRAFVYLLLFTATAIMRHSPHHWSPLPPDCAAAEGEGSEGSGGGDSPLALASSWWLSAYLVSALLLLGDAVVLAGAVHKGLIEWNEVMTMGARRYFGVGGAGLIENVTAICFCTSIVFVMLLRLLRLLLLMGGSHSLECDLGSSPGLGAVLLSVGESLCASEESWLSGAAVVGWM